MEDTTILPLGEVVIDANDVIEVGEILSLVEADGTIVVQGKRKSTPCSFDLPTLDEGSVLSSTVGDGDVSVVSVVCTMQHISHQQRLVNDQCSYAALAIKVQNGHAKLHGEGCAVVNGIAVPRSHGPLIEFRKQVSQGRRAVPPSLRAELRYAS